MACFKFQIPLPHLNLAAPGQYDSRKLRELFKFSCDLLEESLRTVMGVKMLLVEECKLPATEVGLIFLSNGMDILQCKTQILQKRTYLMKGDSLERESKLLSSCSFRVFSSLPAGLVGASNGERGILGVNVLASHDDADERIYRRGACQHCARTRGASSTHQGATGALCTYLGTPKVVRTHPGEIGVHLGQCALDKKKDILMD
ncbi:hypothetical protein SUGI_0061540 [Cryptomeria japonica]|nr:hypothetical protein SUGI_0061540 [Cryptomeria japonica]